MFAKWRKNREVKQLQAICPHEYHVISEYRDCDQYDFWDMCTLYCPLCDYERNVSPETANKILNKQKVREEFGMKLV